MVRSKPTFMKTERIQKNKRWGLRHDRHSVSLVSNHLVFCTKYRKPVLDTLEIRDRCEQVIREVAKDMDIIIVNMAVNSEHVHIFFKYPPKVPLSKIAQKFKAISSKALREEFPHLKKLNKKRLWAPSNYFGSVGAGFAAVENYVRSQEEHHRGD